MNNAYDIFQKFIHELEINGMESPMEMKVSCKTFDRLLYGMIGMLRFADLDKEQTLAANKIKLCFHSGNLIVVKEESK